MAKSRKVIVRLWGGLGNQLFAYAAARRLAFVNDAELVLDHASGFAVPVAVPRSYALGAFRVAGRLATPGERLEPFARVRHSLARRWAARSPFDQRSMIVQQGNEFDERLLGLEVRGTVRLEGYWQSWRYFEDVGEVIRTDLALAESPPDRIRRLGERLRSNNAVAVHVRWFDRDGVEGFNLDAGYYRRALEIIESRIPTPEYFLFSDRPHEAVEVAGLVGRNYRVVDENHGREAAHLDLWLMAQAPNLIIANSTFSWWGAWLARDAKGVIAPAVKLEGEASWGFDGLVPPDWLVV